MRNDLNTKAKRFMAVLDPIKVTLVNFGEEEKELSVPNIPSLKIENPSPSDFHSVFISNVIYIERDDFRELSNKVCLFIYFEFFFFKINIWIYFLLFFYHLSLLIYFYISFRIYY